MILLGSKVHLRSICVLAHIAVLYKTAAGYLTASEATLSSSPRPSPVQRPAEFVSSAIGTPPAKRDDARTTEAPPSADSAVVVFYEQFEEPVTTQFPSYFCGVVRSTYSCSEFRSVNLSMSILLSSSRGERKAQHIFTHVILTSPAGRRFLLRN